MHLILIKQIYKNIFLIDEQLNLILKLQKMLRRKIREIKKALLRYARECFVILFFSKIIFLPASYQLYPALPAEELDSGSVLLTSDMHR